MTMTSKADQLRAQALRLFEAADEVDANYVEEPSFEDGTGLVMFEKQYQQGGRTYIYAAVRVPNMHNIQVNRWYISGSAAMNARYGYTWDQVLEFIQQGYEWRVWNATEIVELASSQV